MEKAEPEKPVETEKEPQEILEILEAPSEVETEREPEKTEIAEQSVDTVETVKEPQEILEILEAPSEADTKNEQTRTIAEAPMTADGRGDRNSDSRSRAGAADRRAGTGRS